jgi:hypothetical protein
LIFPTVHALLGDNPMHSEFACHIGLRGKYFCRVCEVKGSDAADAGDIPVDNRGTPDGTPDNSPAPSVAGSDHVPNSPLAQSLPLPLSPDSLNPTNTPSTPSKAKGRYQESMNSMLIRVKAFVKVEFLCFASLVVTNSISIQCGNLRTRERTMKTLESFRTIASKINARSNLKAARMNSGIKDTTQEFFLGKLFDSYKDKKGVAAKQAALDQAVAALPEDITSPVWHLEGRFAPKFVVDFQSNRSHYIGLDPHQDTPVEILHVVLLGFIKYFWRDLITNQIKDDQKPLLIERLNSYDVRGLALDSSRIAGATLVNYSGSLTGRDFQTISQVVPFVIYDMVPPGVFEAWLSLSKLVPLIYQSTINNINAFVVRKFSPSSMFKASNILSVNT